MTSPETKVIIFGHSYIHWLEQYQRKHRPNLKLNRGEFKLFFQGIRGGQFAWTPQSKSKFQKKELHSYLSASVKSFKPDIVYLQIGTNDLDRRKCDVTLLAKKMETLASFLLTGYDSITSVCIGHAFKRLKPKVGYGEYERRRLLFNNKLSEIGASNRRINVFPNRGFYNNVDSLYDLKGVHLSDTGNLKFAKNLKRSLIFARDKSKVS
ncbi:unnamed protein product, partial [Owenia fusiformis]